MNGKKNERKKEGLRGTVGSDPWLVISGRWSGGRGSGK